MKTMNSLIVATLLSLSTAVSESRAATITEIVASSGGAFDNNRQDFDILLTAVLAAGLDGALADENANLTVFAPNDRAFIRLARDLGYAGNSEANAWDYLVAALTDIGGGDPIPVLTDILLYHVVPTRVTLAQWFNLSFARTQVETLLEGATIRAAFLRVIDNEPDLPNPTIFRPRNLVADNGIIHTINRVLLPIDLE